MLLSWIKKQPLKNPWLVKIPSNRVCWQPGINAESKSQQARDAREESKSHGACAPVAIIQETENYPSDSRRAHATWIWTSTDAKLFNMHTTPFLIFRLMLEKFTNGLINCQDGISPLTF
jgi:hypothetical protein